MKHLFPTLVALALAALPGESRAEFSGAYAIPGIPGGQYATSNSIPVGNWTLSSSVPTAVAELTRAPSNPALNAGGFVLSNPANGTASFSITVPSGSIECLGSLSIAVNIRGTGAVWIEDGQGPWILADTPGLHVIPDLSPVLTPGAKLAFHVMGSEVLALQVVAAPVLDGQPRVAAQAATRVSDTSVRLSADVMNWSVPTVVWFEWGQGDFSQRATAVVDYSTECGLACSSLLTGLLPGTAYQFRVGVSNAVAQVWGETQFFTTAGQPGTTVVGRPVSGAVRLEFTGSPGGLYNVSGSTNLVDWVMVGPAVEVAPGRYQYTDATAPTPAGRCYYRVSSP